MKINRWRRVGLAAAVAACVAVGATAAFATGLVGAGGTLEACAKTTNGQLRLVGAGEACLPSETKVTWNAAGPPGPPGEPGIASNAVSARGGFALDLLPAGQHTTIAELTGLAPGAYAVTGKLRAFSNGGEGLVLCSLYALRSDGVPLWRLDSSAGDVTALPGTRPTPMLPFAATTTLEAGIDGLRISCDRGGSTTGWITIDDGALVAVRVATEAHTPAAPSL